MFLGNVRIYLRGGNVNMPEHDLNRTQISPTFKEMGGKRMPQGMRRYVFQQTTFLSISFQQLPEPLSCHGLAGSGNKQIGTHPSLQKRGSCRFEIAVDFIFCIAAKGNNRSFDPLPNTRRKHPSRLTSISFRWMSSETLNPAAYRSSSIAASRAPDGVVGTGASKRFLTSLRTAHPAVRHVVWGA